MSEPYWVPLGAAPAVDYGRELAYAEFTAGVTPTVAAESAGPVVVTSPAVTTDGSPILVEFYAPYGQPPAVANAYLLIGLWEGAVQIARIVDITNPAAAAMRVPVYSRMRLIPSAGAHTYTVRTVTSSVTGPPQVGAGVGGAGLVPPGFIRITKV